jgi:cytochrome c-type biogenesis protein CcsB
MAITHRCCCRYADGIGVYRFCELCTARSIAVGGPIGARFALELVGHACQPDSGFLELQSLEISTNEQLDSLSYRTITVGFLMLTVGIISGAVWANEAWGSYWSWDPKETWALICWLVYAAYLHTRLSRGWQGRRPALVAVVGLIVIAVCYIGVNLLGIGLHSYGWFF